MRNHEHCLVLALSLVGWACGSGTGELPGHEARSPLTRQSPVVPLDDERALIAANNDFAFQLHHAAGSAGNVVSSPYGVSLALAKAWAGASGDTATEMAAVLDFALPPDRLRAAFDALDLALAGRAGQPLHVVDQIFAPDGYPPQPAYLDVLAESYGAGLQLVDLGASPAETAAAIDDWAAGVTDDRISDLMPGGMMTPDTMLVLADAVYLEAAWHYPFKKSDTRPEAFTRADGSQMTVAMMSGPVEAGLADGPDWEAVDVPYLGDQLSLLILVPERGTFTDFEAELDAARFDAIVAQLETARIVVALPRFSLRTGVALKPELQALGMFHAFIAGDADFSGIDQTQTLFITDLAHQAVMSVDEQGTAAGGGGASLVHDPMMRAVRADRPFLFVVRDRVSGAVLLVGRVAEPR